MQVHARWNCFTRKKSQVRTLHRAPVVEYQQLRPIPVDKSVENHHVIITQVAGWISQRPNGRGIDARRQKWPLGLESVLARIGFGQALPGPRNRARAPTRNRIDYEHE